MLTTFDSTAELKSLFANRFDLNGLETSLAIFLRQLNAALLVSDAESEEYNRYAGVVYRFLEASETSMKEFTSIWEVADRVS